MHQAKKTVRNMAKWTLLAVFALPLLELAAFIAVAVTTGFVMALGLVLASSLAGLLILRHAGHVARVRVALDRGNFTVLHSEGPGGHVLIAGILLLIPGFITDILALCLLIPPLRRILSAAFDSAVAPTRTDAVVDLAPEQWHQVPDASLPDRGQDDSSLKPRTNPK